MWLACLSLCRARSRATHASGKLPNGCYAYAAGQHIPGACDDCAAGKGNSRNLCIYAMPVQPVHMVGAPVTLHMSPSLPLYLSGAQPPGLLVYSTHHTCRLPLALPLARLLPSSTGHSPVMRPDWPAYVRRLANDTSRSRRRTSHTCSVVIKI
jgi:hypothetical protein